MGNALGDAVVRVALEDFARPVVETAPNDGPLVRALYLDPRGFPPGTPYCSLAVWSWEERGARALGLASLPVPGTGLARGWIPLFQKHGTWIASSAFAATPPDRGDVLVWCHPESETNPAYAHRGHTGVIEERLGPGTVRVVEANAASGRGVDRVVRRLDDPLLLGAGRWPEVGVRGKVAEAGAGVGGLALLALLGWFVIRRKRA